MTAAVVVVVAGWLLLDAAPAGADGSRPTNFESQLSAVEPSDAPIEVEVVGGDAFLLVRASAGTEVEIPGYDGEPYLRIDADGTVRRNERSAATYVNATRSGAGVDVPDDVGGGEPRWTTVGTDGEIAWHDHRIHWMLDEAPATGADGFVQNWQVPLSVDGSPVELSGTLVHRDDQLPWAAVLAAVVAVGSAVLARWPRWRLAMLVGAGAAATTLALATWAGNPPGAEPSVLPIALAAGATLAAALTPLVRADLARLALPLASCAALLGWAVDRIGAMWMPVLPGPLPAWVDRVGLAVVLGVAIGVAVTTVLRPEVQRSSGSAPSVKSTMPPAS